MNILFVYPNINGFHEDTYSFGLASIISITRKNGHNVKVLVVKTKEEYADVYKTFASFDPQVVGFSSVSSQYNFVKEMAETIKKKKPGVVTVCGGVHPTINPNSLLETRGLDGFFIGESEYSFIDFLSKLENNRDYKDTDNFAFLEDGKVKINKLKPLLANLDELPFPDRETYPFKETIAKVDYAPFIFSRGCPYLCSYCSNHAIAKVYGMSSCRPRFRGAESSIREIEETLARFSIIKIHIVDDIFGLDKKWRREFCEKYKERIKVKFQCHLRANLVDEEFLKLLKEAGCYRISIAIESGNDHVRNDIMNRHMSNEQIIKAFSLAHKYGFSTNAINIIGVPGETEEMLLDTIKLNREIKPSSSGVNIFYPYKGTELGDYCFEKGLVDEEAYTSFSNERRETILNFPKEHKEKLIYYRKNWLNLVYPHDLKKRLEFIINNTSWGKALKNFKRILLSKLS